MTHLFAHMLLNVILYLDGMPLTVIIIVVVFINMDCLLLTFEKRVLLMR